MKSIRSAHETRAQSAATSESSVFPQVRTHTRAITNVAVLGLVLVTALTLPLCCSEVEAQSQSPSSTGTPGQSAPPTQTQAAPTTFSRPSKDFKYRKRFIAPSSDLNNRIDYASMQSRDSLMLPTYEPTYGKGQTSAAQSKARPPVTYQPIHPDEPGEALKAQAQSLNSKIATPRAMVNRAGFTPPPPPANNQLLPSSLTRQNPAKVSQAPSDVNASLLSAAHIAQVKSHVETLSKSGHLAEAQELLIRVLQDHPHEPVLRAELSKISLERARFYVKQGSTQQAATQARLSIAYGSAYSSASESANSLLSSSLTKAGLDPRNPDVRANLGANLLAANSPLEAEIEYRQAIKLRPSADFYIGAGSASLQSGNRTSAKLDFQKALELNPESQQALSNLGIVRYQMHDYVGANADLTRALVLNSQDTAAAQNLIELWQHQVDSRPQDANAHLGMARAYQVTGDLDSAKKEYKIVKTIDPDHPNLPAARQSFKLALARREARRSFDMAHSLASQGQLSQAYQKASDSVELFPSEPSYQSYKTQLAGQLQTAGLPVYATAGQGIQNLSYMMLQGEQPPSATLPTAQAVGLNNPSQSQYGAQYTGSQSGAPQAPTAPPSPAGQFAADNMYKPLSTDNHVTSMTGFLASLRNFTQQQQSQPSSGSSSLTGGYGAGAGSVPGFAPSNPLPGSGLSASLDQGLLASSTLGSSAGGGAVTPNGSSGSSGGLNAGFMSGLAAALANAGGTNSGIANSNGNYPMNGVATAQAMPMGPYGQQPPAAAPSMAVSNTMAASALGLSPQVAPTIASAMIGGLGKAASHFNANRTQSQATGNVTQQATTTTTTTTQQSPGQVNYGFTPGGNFATNQTMPTTLRQKVMTSSDGNAAQALPLSNAQEPTNVAWPQPQALQDSTASQAAITASTAPTVTSSSATTSDPTSAATAASLAPPIASAGGPEMAGNYLMAGQAGGYAAGVPQLRSLIPPGALKLYLTGVRASKTDVQLQVSLRNDSPVPLKLPGGIKALVRSSGQPDKQAKVMFDSKTVASGSTITGSIRVPGKSLDPTADVIIPTSDLTKGAIADIHLSVPISAR